MLKTLLLERHLTHVQAALWAMTAYFMFSVSDGLAKYLMSVGYDRAMVLVIANMPATFVLTSIMIYRRGLKHAFHTSYKALHIGRAIAIIGVTFFGFLALQYLPMADFYGIVFTGPLLTTIGAFLFFKEKVTLTEAIIILIGFSGTLVIANPTGGEGGELIGYIFAFMGVLCMTSAGLFVRRIGSGEDPHLYVIFANIGVIAANIVPALMSDLPDIQLNHIGCFAIYACTIPTAILILSAVFARAPTLASIAPFQYTQIIWGSIFGFLVFGDIPQINVVIGSMIVAACGLYIIFYHKRKKGRRAMLETQ